MLKNLSVVLLLAFASGVAHSQTFPSKPLRIVVPFPAGGTTDIAARIVAQRIPELPDVPTVRELGYPALELEGWNGLFVAAKTPKEVIDRLHKEAVAAARHPDTVKRFADLAAEAVGSSPADQDAIVRRQAAQFRPIIQTIKLE